MKKKNVIFVICFCCIIILFVISIYRMGYISLTYKSFYKIFSTNLNEVTIITILDGNTGEIHEISKKENIGKIINLFERYEYKKEKSKDIPLGYKYLLRFLNDENDEIFHFTISDGAITYNSSRYVSRSKMIELMDYIKEIIN